MQTLGGIRIADALNSHVRLNVNTNASATAEGLNARAQQQQQEATNSSSDKSNEFATEAMAGHFNGLMTVLRLLLSATPTTTSTPEHNRAVGVVGTGANLGAEGRGH